MIYTLKQLTQIIENEINHPQLNAIHDMAVLNDEGIKDSPTPFLGYDIESGNITGALSYTFILQCLSHKQENNSDLREVQSDTAQILNDVIVRLEALEVLKQEDNEYLLVPISDTINSREGWQVSVELWSDRQSCINKDDYVTS